MGAEVKSYFISVLGPTAAGKTEVSLRLAQQFSWPIFNFDSLQVYRELSIGTSKPTVEERAQAPHFLFDYVSPPQKLSVAQYLKDLKIIFEKISINNGVFVGGSGFYWQAIEKGLYPEAETPDEVRKEVEEWIQTKGYSFVYSWMQHRDPLAAQKISENDHYRIKRSVEILKSQNRNLADLQKELDQKKTRSLILPPHHLLKIGIRCERDKLKERVRQRTQKMLEQGFVQEVQMLLDQGLQDWAPLSSVGYKEVVQFLKGERGDLAELREQIVTSTMQLAKKQMTWFKRDAEILWFDRDKVDEIPKKALAWYQSKIP